MTTGIHRFNLGTFACTVICDGERELTDAMGFVNATRDEVLAEARAYTNATGDPADRVSINILLLDTGRNRVLVDTGNGPGDDPEHGRLLDRLAEAGVEFGGIDTVVITHGHGDHINANTDGAGNPTFPNARYVISATEWQHWTREPGETAQKQLLSIADRFEQVAMDAEIVPGVRAVPAPGHTPGQIALLIESGDSRLLHVADAYHHPVELPRPEWYFSFDADPEATVSTRRALLDLAASQRLLVLPYHFAFPGLGRVVRDGDAWRWQRQIGE
jgi:glyoxylase-like metal-dependent hydrolase (beta-lactamase superfamily II)